MASRKENPKLTSRTPASFKEKVEDMKTILQREKRWLYCGEKISLEAIVNVAVLEFISMEPSARAKVLARRIPEIEAMFEAEDNPIVPEPTVGVGEGEFTDKPKAKKGRTG